MTEDEARAWLIAKNVSRETLGLLEAYVELLLQEAERQNLISESTKDHIWSRHIVDSAQLLDWAPENTSGGDWIDLGSGAGLPGIVIALLSDWKVVLIESRRKRIEFLEVAVHQLGLANVVVEGSRTEKLSVPKAASVISARAFAPLPKLFEAAYHLADAGTFWLLPKGKSWQSDVEAASQQWKGTFHVEQSVTDSESAIVIARGVRLKKIRQ